MARRMSSAIGAPVSFERWKSFARCEELRKMFVRFMVFNNTLRCAHGVNATTIVQRAEVWRDQTSPRDALTRDLGGVSARRGVGGQISKVKAAATDLHPRIHLRSESFFGGFEQNKRLVGITACQESAFR
jgi:hypothetical protein